MRIKECSVIFFKEILIPLIAIAVVLCFAYPICHKTEGIRSLYADCLEYRKNMARNEDTSNAVNDGTQQAAYGKYTELFRLNDDVIRAVLFQCLLLDDLKVENGMVFANLYTIYLLR